MKKIKTNKYIYWTPRILAIIFICFLAMFSFDVFGNGYGFWGTLLGLFMHNIPIFILAGILWIGWRREWLLSLVFIMAGLLYIGRLTAVSITNGFEWYYISWSMTIAAPAFVIGILFWLNWRTRRIKNHR